MKKISLFVVLVMVFSGVMIPMLATENVRAETGQSFTPNIVDHLRCRDSAVYTNALWGAGDQGIDQSNPLDFAYNVQNLNNSGQYAVTKAFLSFNTSSIPDDFEVVEAELVVRTFVCPPELMDILVYNIDFGNTLDTTQAEFNTNGTFEGTFFNSSYCKINNFYSMPVLPENIDKTGLTQYKMVSSTEGAIPTGAGETLALYKNFVYLNITSIIGTSAIVTYNFTAPGMTNCSSTIYIVEIINWNNTHEQIRYEVYLRNESWAWFQVNNSYEFQSAHPCLNVTLLNATTGLYNITESVVDFEWHHLWFLREKTKSQTTLHIRLWHSTLGLGQPDWRYKCVINEGMVYVNITAQWIYNLEDWAVDYGQNYTITVLDYFDNVLTSYSISANAPDMDILIPIDIPTLRVKNYRQQSSMLSVFWNAGGNPYTQLLIADELFSMPLRSGTYMFRITYFYWTAGNASEYAGNSYFWNLTIDGDYNFYISISLITITYVTVNGIEIDVDTITTMVTPSVICIMDEPAMVPTDGISPETRTTFYLDPYFIIETTIRDSDIDNTTAATTETILGLDTSLMSGTVTFLQDIVTISASNASASFILNDTDLSTELINTTAPSGAEYDILVDHYASRGHNISVWVEADSFSVTRTIKFRQSQRFSWEYLTERNYYIATVQVNNSQTLRYIEPHVFIAFHNGTSPNLDTVRLYDQHNNQYLLKGVSFSVDSTGVSFMFANLTTGTQRAFTVDYYGTNQTREGEEWIDPEQEPQWYLYNGKFQMRYVYGSYTNREPSVFTGVIKFSLAFSEAEYIDRGTIIVYDLTNNVELGEYFHWRYTESYIEIDKDYVGELLPGETISIGVFYLKTGEKSSALFQDEVFWGMTVPELFVIISLILIIAGILFRKSKKFKEESKTWLDLGIGILVVIFAAFLLIAVTSG